MIYNLFRERLHWLKLFSLTDIRKAFPSFDSRRLVEWQSKGYIKKVINRWYIFADVSAEERLLLWTSNRIYHPSYISMETALSYYGLIPETVYTTTAVGTLKTKSFDTPLGAFSYRHLKPALFFGYRLLDWKGFPIKMAEPEKVILDYFYLNPQLNQKEDWQGLRLHQATLHERINLPRLEEYLTLFHTKALDKRVSQFLHQVEIC